MHDVILAQQQEHIAKSQAGTPKPKQIIMPDGNILQLDDFDQKIIEQLAKRQQLKMDEDGNLDPD